MVTNEQYEIIKKWGNYLFLFNRKEANGENKEKLKNILQKILLTNAFTWKTDKGTGIIHVQFALGNIQVKVENGLFCVSMDAETNRRLREFKSENHQPVHNEEVPVERKEEVTTLPSAELTHSTETDSQEIAKIEPNPSGINQEMKKEEKEEEFQGESVFLNFLD